MQLFFPLPSAYADCQKDPCRPFPCALSGCEVFTPFIAASLLVIQRDDGTLLRYSFCCTMHALVYLPVGWLPRA
jgi:hypothetical protein